jgi:hypothetical protein
VGNENGLILFSKSDMLYTLCFATCIGDIGLEAKENPSNWYVQFPSILPQFLVR